MRLDDKHGIRLSASDLVRFTACPHAVRLDLDLLRGADLAPVEDSEDAAMLQRHGDEHEAAHLRRLQDEGKQVVRVETQRVSFDEAVRATREALANGPDIIYQGALEGGMWGGFSDFLERVEAPSSLGPFSYEVADTKLKRKPMPGHVLQLVLYSDLLEEMQGRAPEHAHIDLGTGERAGFRLTEYSGYARFARARLEEFVRHPEPTRPVPCSHCDLCRWREHCAGEWQETDSLYRVAGITRSQVAKLEAAGIDTMAALADRTGRVPKLAEETAGKLRIQARLQHARKTGEPAYELRPPVPGKGFELLPQPDPGDLHYDIEGDPFYSEAGAEGIEYLHGVWDGNEFTAFWAHDHSEEKKALAALVDLFEARLREFPKAHIYHYAPYEIVALRRLATRHGLGESLLDRWLRERRFVDLYAVVRGGVFASEASYSLKDMEAFYDMPRTGEVTTAGGSIVAYERWRATRDDAILGELETYNRIDCISLQRLRDWLISVRPSGPWLEIAEGETGRSQAQQTENAELAKLIDASGLPEAQGRMLYDLGLFHWREGKPQAWAVFDAAAKDFEDLCEDMDCLGGLDAAGTQYPEKRSVEREYRYPPQETKLQEGGSALFAKEEGGFATVTITRLNRGRREICVKMGPSQGEALPDRLDLLPSFAINPGPIPAAIRKAIADQCGPRKNRALDDLLSRGAPRFRGRSPLPLKEGVEALDGLIAAVSAMDGSVLPVQGPPGAGKTYVTARAILALTGQGKRVAVSSNSHAAIRNVLAACVHALNDGGSDLTLGDIRIAHKVSSMRTVPDDMPSAISCVTRNDDDRLFNAGIVGGTAWLFCRDEHEGAFDHLFVDEAGQVSLANLVGMSNAADNLVLVGDPRQLPQVIQGAHPYPVNLSCMDWVLGEGCNVDPARGIFLPESWRMHPDLCGYISTQFYEGRLDNHASTAFQAVEALGLPRCGAWRVPVSHEARAQVCPEEVDAIRATVDRLLSGRWTDRHGCARPMQESDIIVVAPYNAQVNALSDALPSIRVGTVDKFQGQEAPVALVSMTASSSEESPRGLEFLLSRERLNVAVSRGQGLSLVFASPRLLHTACSTVEQMRLVNALCSLPETRAVDTKPREKAGAATRLRRSADPRGPRSRTS